MFPKNVCLILQPLLKFDISIKIVSGIKLMISLSFISSTFLNKIISRFIYTDSKQRIFQKRIEWEKILPPESELCELKDADCLLSELDVLLFPSLVLLLMLSILPPLLLVVILSVLENLFLILRPKRSLVLLLSNNKSFLGLLLISKIRPFSASFDWPGRPLNSEIIWLELVPNSIS